MIVLVTFTVGLVFWIVAWASGVKAFDAFLFTSFITVVAAGVRIARSPDESSGTVERPS